MRNNREHDLFKSLADKYVELDGAKLENELNNIETDSIPQPRMPRRRRKSYAAFMAVAAVIIVMISALILAGNIFPKGFAPENKDDMPQSAPNVKLVSQNRFELIEDKEDNGMFIYSFKDKKADDAIITLEKSEMPDTSLMVQDNLNGEIIYWMSDTRYKKLIYENKGYVISMYCCYELETLKALYNDMEIIL